MLTKQTIINSITRSFNMVVHIVTELIACIMFLNILYVDKESFYSVDGFWKVKPKY